MTSTEINVVAYQKGNLWIAQCVEYDIQVLSHTLLSLPSALKRAIKANLLVNAECGRTGLEGIPPAPGKFISMYENARMNVQDRQGNIGNTSTNIVVRDIRLAELT